MFSKSKIISSLLLLAVCSVVFSAPTDDTTTTTSTTTTTTAKSNTEIVCNLSKSSELEQQLLAKVNAIKGHKFEWSDDDHKYYFSVCSTADNADSSDVGFVQVNSKGVKFVLGRLNDVDLEGACKYLFNKSLNSLF